MLLMLPLSAIHAIFAPCAMPLLTLLEILPTCRYCRLRRCPPVSFFLLIIFRDIAAAARFSFRACRRFADLPADYACS